MPWTFARAFEFSTFLDWSSQNHLSKYKLNVFIVENAKTWITINLLSLTCTESVQIYGAKKKFLRRKKFNSHRIGLGQQYGRRIIVFGTQIWPPLASCENALWFQTLRVTSYNDIFLGFEFAFTIKLCTNINHKGLQRTANEYAEERRIYKNLISKNNNVDILNSASRILQCWSYFSIAVFCLQDLLCL